MHINIDMGDKFVAKQTLGAERKPNGNMVNAGAELTKKDRNSLKLQSIGNVYKTLRSLNNSALDDK